MRTDGGMLRTDASLFVREPLAALIADSAVLTAIDTGDRLCSAKIRFSRGTAGWVLNGRIAMLGQHIVVFVAIQVIEGLEEVMDACESAKSNCMNQLDAGRRSCELLGGMNGKHQSTRCSFHCNCLILE